MKTFYLCLLMTFVLISCDTNIDNQNLHRSEAADNPVYKTGNGYPVSGLNPYDSAGEVHNEIAESYIGGSQSVPRSLLAAKLDSIAFTNPGYMFLEGNYTALDTATIHEIMEAPEVKLQQLLDNSSLSNQARQQATSFIYGMLDQLSHSKEEEVLSNYISGYETTVINLPNPDRKTLLTLSAVIKHAVKFAKKPKRKPRDRDWDISVACLVAGLSGSLDSPQMAVMNLLYAEILINE